MAWSLISREDEMTEYELLQQSPEPGGAMTNVMIVEAGDRQVWGSDGPLAAGDNIQVVSDIADSLVARGFATRLGSKK